MATPNVIVTKRLPTTPAYYSTLTPKGIPRSRSGMTQSTRSFAAKALPPTIASANIRDGMIGKHKLQTWAAGSALPVLLREIYAVEDVSTGRADRDEAYGGGAQGFTGVCCKWIRRRGKGALLGERDMLRSCGGCRCGGYSGLGQWKWVLEPRPTWNS